jgi:cell division septal protein FtsQ
MEPENQEANKAKRRGVWALWIGVVLAFLLVITAWTILIKIAKENPVEQIKMEQSAGSD